MTVPSTIIIDIDGCIFQHLGKGASRQWSDVPTLLPGVREMFDEWEKSSSTIIMMTARKESCRQSLEYHLSHYCLFWDHLIMGVTHGPRILINDKKPGNEIACLAVEVSRNGDLYQEVMKKAAELALDKTMKGI